ncbi:hypothetical protein PoB_005504000 [Plakobranchus ocellatus]|uniref:Uncharacterized protein n=1 Tax=Plakobranchus ocellatus TaxID=259542 RepID=A0AAV4CA05_9GAST|nr:hypothetical protein PoB_005504000 [Plakobranchus ocellatus]
MEEPVCKDDTSIRNTSDRSSATGSAVTETAGVGGSVASDFALRSAGTLLSRVRAPPLAPWPDGEPESLRSPCCGLAIHKNRPEQW